MALINFFWPRQPAEQLPIDQIRNPGLALQLQTIGGALDPNLSAAERDRNLVPILQALAVQNHMLANRVQELEIQNKEFNDSVESGCRTIGAMKDAEKDRNAWYGFLLKPVTWGLAGATILGPTAFGLSLLKTAATGAACYLFNRAKNDYVEAGAGVRDSSICEYMDKMNVSRKDATDFLELEYFIHDTLIKYFTEEKENYLIEKGYANWESVWDSSSQNSNWEFVRQVSKEKLWQLSYESVLNTGKVVARLKENEIIHEKLMNACGNPTDVEVNKKIEMILDYNTNNLMSNFSQTISNLTYEYTGRTFDLPSSADLKCIYSKA